MWCTSVGKKKTKQLINEVISTDWVINSTMFSNILATKHLRDITWTHVDSVLICFTTLNLLTQPHWHCSNTTTTLDASSWARGGTVDYSWGSQWENWRRGIRLIYSTLVDFRQDFKLTAVLINTNFKFLRKLDENNLLVSYSASANLVWVKFSSFKSWVSSLWQHLKLER